jgi:hypothetical protein
MRRFFDFECEQGHKTERFINSEIREIPCPMCGKQAHRLISTPRVSLDGISGDFPGAADKWVQRRAEKLKAEQSKSYYEGN